MNEYRFQKRPFPRVALHSESVKHLNKGHPWITEDNFTVKFPKDKSFLIGSKGDDDGFCLLMHDPNHKNVKARIWTTKGPFVAAIKNFGPDLTYRLIQSFERRFELKIDEERENGYLVFGESDEIPGLHILKLKDTLIIQYYAGFWKTFEHLLLDSLSKALTKSFGEKKKFCVWIQERNSNKAIKMRNITLPSKGNLKPIESFELNEFGINYEIQVNQNYDLGLYTDMAAIRKELGPYFSKANSLLNLFCYTGAFSLYALQNNFDQVTSVDLSKKYMAWLERNLELNPKLAKEKHSAIVMPCDKALVKLNKENKKFDLIICDPPSFSGDGKKQGQAFKGYETLLPLMEKALTEDGRIIVFLNTHSVSLKKFENKLLDILDKRMKIEKHLKMKEDAKTLATFREGNYLKGIILKR